MIRWLTLLLITSCACAQLANLPPAPSWLEPQGVARTTFRQERPLLKAILFIVSTGETAVMMNDKPVVTTQQSPQAASYDVTKFIHLGDNVITCKGSRFAALLELNGDTNRKTWLKSDDTWQIAKAGLQIDLQSADNPFDLKKTFDAYNSWQLAKPGTQNQATPESEITVPDGFKVELVRSAQAGEDSWVSMAFDSSGRITLGKEKKGLLRLTISGSGDQKMETIEDTLLECRGLLYAHGALFANANNSKTLFKLRDVDGDGVFEEKTALMQTGGGVGHGRNHLKLGPDGNLYMAHGNNVLLPENLSPASPLKNYQNDQLLPNPWDGSMFDGNVELPAGHILRVSPDGKERVLLAGGLRNPLDIAFNKKGDLFTFDADMERDVGTHFYMPTRVLQIVPGADYGWRRGTGRWPAWYADTLPSVVDIGLASPTAVFFGYSAAFPPPYNEALFICDWSYGRLIAIHLQKQGLSYVGTQETFATGRPLNLTDGAIGPDGALWFITGGRGTQSGLYRITFTGKKSASKPMLAATAKSTDRIALHQARMSLENTPEKLIITQQPSGENIAACLAAVRTGSHREEAVAAAHSWLAHENTDIVLAALRILEIAAARGQPIEPFALPFPTKDARLNRELCKWMVHFQTQGTIQRVTAHLPTLTTSEDLVCYPMLLRYIKDGWQLADRRAVFEALNKAEQLNGASTYFKIISDTRAELAAALSPADALSLASIVHPAKPTALLPTALPGHSFKQWTVADLEPQLAKVKSGRSFDSAKSALISAQCVFCHKVTADPSLPAGIIGPDLVQVRSRFSARDLLMHILQPSLVIDEKFRSIILIKTNGQTVAGTLESEDDERVVLKPNPLAPDVIETAKAQIQTRKVSDISPMPAGLLNALKQEQILDLLAWFEATGDPKSPVWQP